MKIQNPLTCLFLLISITFNAVAQNKDQLPSRIDNSTNPYMRPVFNQSGPSCVAANWVGNMFNYEINLKRGLSSDSIENQYPIYFSFNFGNHSYETAHENGIPLSQVYGHTISNDDNSVWPTGYSLYYNAMKNRVKSNEWFDVSTQSGLDRLKHWLYNHEGDTALQYGGVATFGISMGGIQYDTIVSGYEQGKNLIAGLGEGNNHLMTFVGYDDNIKYDWNKDGEFTNDLDINGDEVVDMRDWECGALIALNTWGEKYKNEGRVYFPYCLLKYTGVEIIHLYDEPYYTPQLTAKVKMTHEMRNTISLRVGISQNIQASKPEYERSYVIFDRGKSFFSKQDVPMLGSGNYDPIEIGLDISDLLFDIDPSRPVKLFFNCISDEVEKQEPKGEIISFSVINYNSDGKSIEYVSPDKNIAIKEGQTARAAVVMPGNSLYPPVNLAASRDEKHIQLKWSEPLWENNVFSGYQLFRNDEKIADLDKTITEYSDKLPVKEASTYYLRSVYLNDGDVLYSAPSNGAAVVMDVQDYCLQLDGKTNYVSIPPLHLYSEGTTVEMWVKSSGFLDPQTVFLQNSKGASDVSIKMNHSRISIIGEKKKKENRLRYSWRGAHGGEVLPDDTWTHLAIVAYADSLVLYMNDSVMVKEQKNLMDNFNYETFLGGLPFSDKSRFNGCIDDVKIWNRALSRHEILNPINKTLGGQMNNGLVAWYNFNEPGGSRVVDATGRYHGTLNGNLDNSRTLRDSSLETKHSNIEPEIICVSTDKKTHLPMQFSNPAHNTINDCYEWFFEGASPQQAFNASPKVTYSQPGDYTVRLKYTNSQNDTQTIEDKITIKALTLPQVKFDVSSEQIHINDSIFFTDQTNNYPESWHWKFEGGTPDESKLQNPIVTYKTEGVFDVQLVVANARGEKTLSKQKQITVKGSLPTAGFTVSDEEIIKGDVVTFTDTTLTNPNKWQWEFEGGTPSVSQEKNPLVQYNNPGIYRVRLVAYNKNGQASLVKEHCVSVSNVSAGNAMFFNGENNVVVIDSILNQPIEAYTVEFWIKPNSQKNWNQKLGGGWGRFLFHCNFDGTISAGLLGGGLTRIDSKANMLDIGLWQHFAFTFNQGEMRLYKNGLLIGSSSCRVRFAPAWQYFVAGRSRPNGAIDGLVDELRVWTKARSQKEIQSTMNIELQNLKKYKNLELYLNFNVVEGGELTDQTGKHKARILHYSEEQKKFMKSTAFCR